MRRSIGLALAAVMLAACGPTTVTVIPDSDLPEDVYGSPTPAQVEELPARAMIYFVRSRRLVTVQMSLPETGTLPEALMETLLDGPPSGYRSAIPPETRLISISVEGGVATVDLSDEFERSAPGRVLALRVAQVVYTATETPGVFAVRFAIEGVPKGVIAGEDRVVRRPVTRADYDRFGPPGDDEEDGDEAA